MWRNDDSSATATRVRNVSHLPESSVPSTGLELSSGRVVRQPVLRDQGPLLTATPSTSRWELRRKSRALSPLRFHVEQKRSLGGTGVCRSRPAAAFALFDRPGRTRPRTLCGRVDRPKLSLGADDEWGWLWRCGILSPVSRLGSPRSLLRSYSLVIDSRDPSAAMKPEMLTR